MRLTVTKNDKSLINIRLFIVIHTVHVRVPNNGLPNIKMYQSMYKTKMWIFRQHQA